MSVSCECFVLSGRGLCDGLITRPEESYRLWCVSECEGETSTVRKAWPTRGCCAIKKNSMGQRRSEVNNSSANPDVSYFMGPGGSSPFSQQPATCPCLGRNRSTRRSSSYLLKTHFNVNRPSTSRSSTWSPSFRLPHRNPLWTSLIPRTGYVSPLSHFL
jgi:hypothetical protein